MRVIELDKKQVTYLYEKSMMVDFPDNERKPLAMILSAMDQGAYDCLGMVKDDKIIAYAFFMKIEKDYLFDYFVVLDGNRNNGIGSLFLSKIKEHYLDAGSVIGEVEDFSVARSESERDIQNRRFHFYLRNGYVDTGVRVKMYDVDYCIIEMDNGKNHTEEEIKELYRMHYKAIFSKAIYETKVIIKE